MPSLMSPLRAAWLISLKDLRERLRDRSAIFVGAIVPFGLAAIFSLILGGVGEGDLAFRFVVANLDEGNDVADAFVDEVLPGLEEGTEITVEPVRDAAAAEAAVAGGDAEAAFVIPAGFTQSVTTGQSGRISVIGAEGSSIATEVARSVAERFADRLGATQLAVAVVAAGGGLDDPEAVAQRAAAIEPPVGLEELVTERKQLDFATYYSAGMAIFFLFFTVQFGVTSLLEERQNGTLARLLVAPVARWSIVAGKALTSVLLGVTSMTVLVAGTALLLGADWGSPAGVALLVLAGIAAAVGVMAVVASIARTAEQANVWQSIIAVVLGLFGGVFFPIADGPGLLANLSLLTPHRWFMRGLEEMAGGGGPGQVVPAVAAMGAFAAVGFLVAVLVGRRTVSS